MIAKNRLFTTALLLLCSLVSNTVVALEPLRRPISPQQPAWIIHIDVWNEADPQKIINMVPEDVRPYVIFSISTSSNDSRSPNGPAIYDSWMKVCAQNRVWTVIQCASGAHNRMPDTPDDVSAYEQYFKDYPNFLGFSFAEQFWDFGKTGCPTFPERLQLFAKLLPLCRDYGGYLIASFTDSYYNASKMPMAWMKRNADIKAFMSSYPEHFLCFEKYTQKKGFLDIESNCLGHWLAGYAGQYGIRFDSSGWIGNGVKPDSENNTKYTLGTVDFIPAAGAMPVAEHLMLTGQTMMDGPELTWKECSKEGSTTTVDGYTRRNWQWFPQFTNISLDLFRKILDGTIRIPTRQEVISRTKVCLVNDKAVSNVNNENERAPYVTPERLFDGLYRHDCDQGGRDNKIHWIENRWWMKSTGRFPTIPQVYQAPAGMTTFKVSTYNKTNFDNWMKSNFPEEYTGNIYAGRHENGWVTYNPFQYSDVTDDNGVRTLGKTTARATGTIPFQYNTCTSIRLDYAPYAMGIIKEYTDRLSLYLSDYQPDGTVSEEVIRINGATSQPQVTWTDRGSHPASNVVTSWEDGVLTISISHNGPLELDIQCSGNATGRKTLYTTAAVSTPQLPAAYTGTLQYEAEHADYKSIAACRKNGYNYGHAGYQGQGFVEMGTSTSGALRFYATVPENGRYKLSLRYQATADGKVVVSNGSQNLDCQLAAVSEWTENAVNLQLSKGSNTIYVKNTDGRQVFLDCIRLEHLNSIALNNQSDNSAAISTAAESGLEYDEVILDGRTLYKDGNWNTLCLPFALTDAQVSSQLAPARLVTLGSTTFNNATGALTMNFVEAAAIEAGKPYMIKWNQGSNLVNPTFSGVTIQNTAATVTTTYADFEGCFSPVVLTANDKSVLYLSDNNALYYPTADKNIRACRAYFRLKGITAGDKPLQARYFTLNFDGETTALAQLPSVEGHAENDWYTLDGLRLNGRPANKGIYIHQQKVIVK